MERKWQLLYKEDVATSVPDEILSILLKNRGISSSEETKNFLNPKLNLPALYSLFPQEELGQALALINQALRENWPVIIHGDFDVDGICGTAILWEAIYHYLGFRNVRPFIPHRLHHGYGVSKESVQEVLNLAREISLSSPVLLITTDCGISACEAIKFAQKDDVKVIVTDHHTPPKKLPSASAILHTEDLCGAAIAWVLAQQLIRGSGIGELTGVTNSLVRQSTNSLDLVALATIADVQPLTGFNRALVKLGLERLNNPRRVGLQALYKVSGIENREVGPYEVGWVIAPRLNAAGRLENAMESLRLLCTKDWNQALTLSENLNRINQQRQEMTEKAVQQAERESYSVERKVLVLHHPDWHEGVVGLIASKMVDRYFLPTIAISEGEKYSKGSARSVKGVSIIKALRKTEELLIDVGGHDMAAGFTIKTARIEEFAGKLGQVAQEEFPLRLLAPALKLDLELDLNQISWALCQAIQKLRPHGMGNPRPLFLSRDIEVVDFRPVGQENQHLKLLVKSNKGPQITFSAIGFGLGHWSQKLNPGDRIDIAYKIEEDQYRGRLTLQLTLKDLRLSS